MGQLVQSMEENKQRVGEGSPVQRTFHNSDVLRRKWLLVIDCIINKPDFSLTFETQIITLDSKLGLR